MKILETLGKILTSAPMICDHLGYAHPNYALSFREFGEPHELPHCGGWILERGIAGTPYKDGIGCYPLFACRDWTKLHRDLEEISSDVISVALVTDPFSGVAPTYLEQCFDIVKPFKTHYISDLRNTPESFIHKDHLYKSRKALKVLDVEICSQPISYLNEWIKLYDELIRRHKIKGFASFSSKCFEIQLSMPGMVMFLGRLKGEIVGATLILVVDQVAHFHLAAFTGEGYQTRASYGLHRIAIDFLFNRGIRYLNHGGVAGLNEKTGDGLAQFKRCWSNLRTTVYFCGRVFDRQKYESICEQNQIGRGEYFPAYRAGEIL
jgi:hypothetical protein